MGLNSVLVHIPNRNDYSGHDFEANYSAAKR